MGAWPNAWQLIKDVALTGTGLFLIVLQVLAKHPSDTLLVTGLALTVPSVATHASALVGGKPADGRSSPHSPPSGHSPSSPSSPQEAADE